MIADDAERNIDLLLLVRILYGGCVSRRRLTETPYNIGTLCHRRSETAATVDGKFARMNWPRRRQVAGIKMKRVDADHSSIELGIRL